MEHKTKLYFHLVWNSHNNKLGQNSLPIKRSQNIKTNELYVNQNSYFLCSNFSNSKLINTYLSTHVNFEVILLIQKHFLKNSNELFKYKIIIWHQIKRLRNLTLKKSNKSFPLPELDIHAHSLKCSIQGALGSLVEYFANFPALALGCNSELLCRFLTIETFFS